MKEFRWFYQPNERETVDPTNKYVFGSCALHDVMTKIYKIVEIHNTAQQAGFPANGLEKVDFEHMVFEVLVALANGFLGDSDEFQISAFKEIIRRKSIEEINSEA